MIRDLVSIDWFSNVGHSIESDLGPLLIVSSWHEAADRCGAEWEDVSAEARNNLTMHLNRVCTTEFQKWNKVIVEIKNELHEPWRRMREKVAELELPPVVADCVEWDTMHALAEQHYEEWNPPLFFGRLLKIYELGHFPCGWSGTWPNGELVVF